MAISAKDMVVHCYYRLSQQDGRRSEFTFKIKRHSHQRCSEGSNELCAHQDPGTPQRLRQNCV